MMIKKINLLLTVVALTLWSCNQDNEQEQINQSSSDISTKEIHTCIDAPLLNNNPTGKPNAAIYTQTKWTTGQTIRIKFLNGDTYLQGKVKQYANYWTTYANIKFQYVPITENADVKIAFKWSTNGKIDTASWSYLGTQSQYKSQNEPTMNFGWFDVNTTETELNRVILHEFGHLLGLIHEHQNPAGNILWNKPAVYEYYRISQGWTTAQVDTNIFTKYDETVTNYSVYDNTSIMHYPISASLTTNGYSVGINENLSNIDKQYISKAYPQANLYQGQRLSVNQRITSPNGRFHLTINYSNLAYKLIIFDDLESKTIWSRTPNIKLNNFSSSNVYCELRGGELLLFQGSVSKLITGDSSLIYANYITIRDNGDIHLIKNNIAVWSLFNGKI